MLKKPKNDTEKYFAQLASGMADDMEDISEEDDLDDQMTFGGVKDSMAQVTEVAESVRGTLPTAGDAKEESEEEEVKIVEETIVEDLSDIKDPISVTPIDDWEKRFRLANYTSEQKRIVNLAQDKRKEWLETFRKTDWTMQ